MVTDRGEFDFTAGVDTFNFVNKLKVLLNDKFGINYFCARALLNNFLYLVVDNDALFFHFFNGFFDFTDYPYLFVTGQTKILNDSCQGNCIRIG